MLKESNTPELEPTATPATFESFKDSLPAYESDELISLLDNELTIRAASLIEVYSAPNITFEERRKAILDYGIAAMAKHGLVSDGVPLNPYDPLPAVDFSRQHLETYAAGDQLQLSILARTVFFSDSEQSRRSLGEMISASVTPWGEYDDETLAAGVVSHRVFAQLL